MDPRLRLLRNNKCYLSWRSIDGACQSIIQQIKNAPEPVEVGAVIGLSRGGLIPATYLANHLSVREVYVHGYHSYDDETNMRDSRNDHGIMYQDSVPVVRGMVGADTTILIVDDLCDEGITMQGLVARFNNSAGQPLQLKTATLYCKPHSVFEPDYVGESIDDMWLVFPWELQDKT